MRQAFSYGRQIYFKKLFIISKNLILSRILISYFCVDTNRSKFYLSARFWIRNLGSQQQFFPLYCTQFRIKIYENIFAEVFASEIRTILCNNLNFLPSPPDGDYEDELRQQYYPNQIPTPVSPPGYSANAGTSPGYSAHPPTSPGYSANQSTSPGYSAHQGTSPDYSVHPPTSPDYPGHNAGSSSPRRFAVGGEGGEEEEEEEEEGGSNSSRRRKYSRDYNNQYGESVSPSNSGKNYL